MTASDGPFTEAPDPRSHEAPWRVLLLAVIALGAVGLVAELLLLEHWIAVPQWTPLVTLTLILAATVAVARRPSGRALRVFRMVMAWAVFAGLLGIGLHLQDNLLFEQEVASDASPLAQTWQALRGATPLLAPGSLAQLGLLGLLFTYRHPGLRAQDETEIQ